MAKSARKGKMKESSRAAELAVGSNGDGGCTDADLLKAIGHPLRRQALRILHASEGSVSPVRIDRELELGDGVDENLSSVSYHVRVLAGYKAIRHVDQRQVRGAMEHFYASCVEDLAWLRGVLSRTQESDEEALRSRRRRRGGGDRTGERAD
jgi:DNA-binding transcriptional ArsR family regulator